MEGDGSNNKEKRKVKWVPLGEVCLSVLFIIIVAIQGYIMITSY